MKREIPRTIQIVVENKSSTLTVASKKFIGCIVTGTQIPSNVDSHIAKLGDANFASQYEFKKAFNAAFPRQNIDKKIQ